jgi:hypothetical protein
VTPLVVLVVIIVLAFAGLGIAAISREPRVKGPNKTTRAYLDELEGTLEHIAELAYDNKTFDPSFADIVIDEIKMHRQRVKTKKLKELE